MYCLESSSLPPYDILCRRIPAPGERIKELAERQNSLNDLEKACRRAQCGAAIIPVTAQFGVQALPFENGRVLSVKGSQGPAGTWIGPQNKMPNLGTDLIDSIPCNLQASCNLEQFCQVLNQRYDTLGSYTPLYNETTAPFTWD